MGQQYRVEPFKFLDPPLRLEFSQAIKMLKEAGKFNLCPSPSVLVNKWPTFTMRANWVKFKKKS